MTHNTDQVELFDRHERPDIKEYISANGAWLACEDYEDYVYSIAQNVSESVFDRLISDVRALYDEYFDYWESGNVQSG